MAKNCNQHYRELLITLDYLLNHTDENNPATTIGICEYASEVYSLKFNKDTLTGNDIDRRRIGKLLDYLNSFSVENEIPFVLEKTRGGKYYVEQKNYLDEKQLLLLLAAVKNDKYTRELDTDFLVDRLLDVFGTSEEKRDDLKLRLQKLVKGVKKIDKSTMVKIKYIEQAYQTGKMIKIKERITDVKRKIRIVYDLWYRVYMIKEFKNKLYAFLLPVDTKDIRYINNYIFKPIEDLDIPTDNKETVLEDDYEKNRDFNALFRLTNPSLAKKYETLDNMIESTLLPQGGKAYIVSFYFNLALKDILKKSFESFFSEEFRYQETNNINGIEKNIKGSSQNMDYWVVVAEESKENSKPTHGLVNISVDNHAFKSWLLSDPHGEGTMCIADMITIIKPLSIKSELGRYHAKHLSKYMDSLSNEEIKELLDLEMFA